MIQLDEPLSRSLLNDKRFVHSSSSSISHSDLIEQEKLKEREEVSEDDSIHSGTGGPKRKDSSARINRFEGEIKKRRESEVGGKDENKMELDNVKTAEPHLREDGGELEEGEI